MNAEVLALCDQLLRALQGEERATREAGAAALAHGALDDAERAVQRAKTLEAIRNGLEDVRKTLKAMLVDAAGAAPGEGVAQGRAPNGAKTPAGAYRVPILQILVSNGGSAPSRVVLDAIHERMKDSFNAWDLAPMPSDPRAIRWRRTAEWCRNSMRVEGLLAFDSPHGIWEITEAGRRWLEEREQQACPPRNRP